MEAKVREGYAPAVVVALAPGEKLTSEAGAMMFISGDVTMDVEMPGGVTGGLKRALLAGESLFLATYTARGAGAVGLCGLFPGSVRQHELDGEIICEKHVYLGHFGEVEISSALAQRVGMGIMGGGEESSCNACRARAPCGCTEAATSSTSTSRRVRRLSSTPAAW
jgi:uncharacterized protein (AIM24 family)